MSYMLRGVHVYVEPGQPATRYVDRLSGRARWFRCNPRRLWWTDCCSKKRWAKYVRVCVYYDGIHRFCAKGRGCKT